MRISGGSMRLSGQTYMEDYMKTFKKLLPKNLWRKKGATMLEYALIVSLISLAAIGSIPIIRDRITPAYSLAAATLP